MQNTPSERIEDPEGTEENAHVWRLQIINTSYQIISIIYTFCISEALCVKLCSYDTVLQDNTMETWTNESAPIP